MKTILTANEVINYISTELSYNNTIVLATIGNGGAGLTLSPSNDDFKKEFIAELESMTFDGIVSNPCADLTDSEYYNDDCQVYSFSKNGSAIEIIVEIE